MPGRANVEIYACDADDMGWYDVVDFKALSSDERIRAERFFDSQDAHRYRIAHALLRSLLGAATGMPAAALVLKAGRHGKPYLSNGPSFNLSHSGSRIVIGLMQRGKIGVDVEVIKPIEDADRLALRWFSEEEVEALSSLRGEQWLIGFFRIWTRKEAFVKALGGGLSIALDSFSVSLDDVSDDLLLSGSSPLVRRQTWSIRAIDIEPGVEAAVAVDCKEFELRNTLLTPDNVTHTLVT